MSKTLFNVFLHSYRPQIIFKQRYFNLIMSTPGNLILVTLVVLQPFINKQERKPKSGQISEK